MTILREEVRFFEISGDVSWGGGGIREFLDEIFGCFGIGVFFF